MSCEKTAIVTGAAQGIGRAIALRLAADGFNVLVTDINAEKLASVREEILLNGWIGAAISGDISDTFFVQKVVEEAVAHFGGVHVMVANAGIWQCKALQDVKEEEWDKVISINVKGTMLCFKYAAQHMIKQGLGGVLIAAASINSKKAVASCAAYCVSKFAVRGLVQSAACDLAQFGIRVNAYSPGQIDTDMMQGAYQELGMPDGEEVLSSSALIIFGSAHIKHSAILTYCPQKVQERVYSQASWPTRRRRGSCLILGLRKGPVYHRHIMSAAGRISIDNVQTFLTSWQLPLGGSDSVSDSFPIS